MNTIEKLESSAASDAVLHGYAWQLASRPHSFRAVLGILKGAYKLGQIDEGLGIHLPDDPPEVKTRGK